MRVLQVTILWVAVFTFAAAFANGFSQLLGIRFLQGLGYGGEGAVGGVLISKVVRPALRGRAWFKAELHVDLGRAGLTLPGRMMAP